MNKEGFFYLFTLRLVPLFPFFVINLVMGLTGISTKMFALISQAGMLPATIVFVNAGRQLAKIDTVSNILSPGIISSFVLIGVFPIITKYMVGVHTQTQDYGRIFQTQKSLITTLWLSARVLQVLLPPILQPLSRQRSRSSKKTGWAVTALIPDASPVRH